MKKGDRTRQCLLKKIGVKTAVFSALVILLTALLTQIGEDIYNSAKNIISPSPDSTDNPSLVMPRWESMVKEDVLFYSAKLAKFPKGDLDGADILDSLQASVKQVEANPKYQQLHSETSASLWKIVGGAYLINRELPNIQEKIRAALPCFHRSLKQNPKQDLLRGSVSILQEALDEVSVDPLKYITATLQILRGDDPEIPSIANEIASFLISPELEAERWLLNKATKNSIIARLKAYKLILKKEKGLEFELKITTSQVAPNLYEVRVGMGPNIYLWEVNFAEKQYRPKNQLTSDFMRLLTKD